MLPNEDQLCLSMTSSTMYSQTPILPVMTRRECRAIQRIFEARLPGRKLLSLVCTDCVKVKASVEFSDYHLSKQRKDIFDSRHCLSCALDRGSMNNFNHGGVLSFACFGCKKGLPLVRRRCSLSLLIFFFFFADEACVGQGNPRGKNNKAERVLRQS